MGDPSPHSLHLTLDALVGRVVLTASAGYEAPFAALAGRYASLEYSGALSGSVPLEEFLVNLGPLADWPEARVEWDSALAALVRGNAADAKEMKRALQHVAEPNPEAVSLENWTAPLKPFQMRDISRLLQLDHGANFSVPGAGKTRVALAIFHARRMAGLVNRLLVIAPKSAFEAWEAETIECFGDRLQLGSVGERVTSEDALVVNYERLSQRASDLATWLREQPAMMVVDEAHRMKLGAGGVYGRLIFGLAPLARHRLALTGTPAPNGVKDLQNVMSFPWPGTGRAQVVRATRNGDLRKASQALRPLFVRTTKSELDLPPCVPRVVPVELPPLHEKVYRALLGHFAAEAPDLARLGKVVLYLLMAADSPSLIPLGSTRYEPLQYMVPPVEPDHDIPLRELMRALPGFEVSPKFLEAARICAANANVGRKTIVWSTFVRSLVSLEQLMLPLQPAVVHGGTPDREAQLLRFREDSDCWVLLTNPATLGEGINLHKVANDAVYVDRDFAAGRYLQSVDRIHRLGLPRDAHLNVSVLSAVNTIDEIVESRLSAKLRFMSEVLDDPDIQQLADLDEDPQVPAGLSSDDLSAVLGHLNRDS